MTRAAAIPGALAVLVAAAAACSDSTRPVKTAVQTTPLDSLPGLIVSQPVSGSGGASGTVRGLRSSPLVAGGVVYISLVPGMVPDGLRATIWDQVTGQVVTTSLVDGGFDPVAIVANVGDTLLVEITRSGSDGPVRVGQTVRAIHPPVVVRTSPPRGGRDVPLNASMVIVFSEPIDSVTLTTASVQLWRDSTAVPGTVRFRDSLGIRAEFHPDSLLARQTDYRLLVTRGIRDVNGAALDSVTEVRFTAGVGVQVVAQLWVTGLWYSLASGAAASVTVTATDRWGNSVASYTGTVHFTATDPAAILPPDYTFVSADAGSHTFPVTFKTFGSQEVTATDVDASSITGSQTVTVVAPVSGTGTATIDGIISPGEWDRAARIDFAVNLPRGGTAPATLFVMNNAKNLYVAVRFARSFVDSGGNSLALDFANNDDGVWPRIGDDALVMDPIGPNDEFRTNAPPCPPGGPLCYSLDTDIGGRSDGAGAFHNDGALTVYEISHPLNSGDAGHDFALHAGDRVGMSLFLRMAAGASYPADYADTTYPQPWGGDFLHILIAR